MTIDEKTRLDLRQEFEKLLGARLADATMEAMPPLDYQQLATKTDVNNLGMQLRGETAELRGEMAELRGEMGELRGEMSELRSDLRGEMSELRSDLRGEMGELRVELGNEVAKLGTDMSTNLRTMVLTQLTTTMALIGFVAGFA